METFWSVEIEREDGKLSDTKRFNSYTAANDYFLNLAVPPGCKGLLEFSSPYDARILATSETHEVINVWQIGG